VVNIVTNPRADGKPWDWIVNDLLGPKPIAQSGFHRVVQVANAVFDNFFQLGIQATPYYNAMQAPAGVTIK
jgi:hypothetical protein